MVRLTIAVLNAVLAVCSLCSGQDFTEMRQICQADKPCFESMRSLLNEPVTVTVAAIDTSPFDFGPMRALASGVCNCTEDGVCTCGARCDCQAKKKLPDKTPDPIAEALKSISERLDRIEASSKQKTSAHLTPEPPKKMDEVRARYPVNNRARWHRFSGNHRVSPSLQEIRNHLKHDHPQLDPEWIDTLNYEECESVHTDAHENRLQPEARFAVSKHAGRPKAKPPAASEEPKAAAMAPNEYAVAIDGRMAKYRAEVSEQSVWTCGPRGCYWKKTPQVKSQFVEWIN